MTAVKNLASKLYRNGAPYYSTEWTNISASWIPNRVGRYDGGNYVTVIRFETASYADSIVFKWSTADACYGNGTLNYKLIDSEDNSLNNATASTAGDGKVVASQSPYSRNTLTINRTIAPGTHYLYLWSGSTGEYDNTSIYWGTGGDFGVVFEYNAIAGTPSTISVSGTAVFGRKQTIKITANNSQFVHTLRWSFAGKSGTIADRTTSREVSWTPSADTFGAYIPKAKIGELTISCTTYIGTEQIGSAATVKRTMALPSYSITALDGWAVVSYSNDNTAAAAKDVCLQGLSKISVSFDNSKVSTMYGATLELKAKHNSKEVTASGIIGAANAGDNEITLTAIDSRGVSVAQSVTIYAYPYSIPVLGGVTAVRSNSAGTADDAGAFVNAKADLEYSAAGGAIVCSLYAQIKTPNGSYGDKYTMTPAEANVIGGALDEAQSYVVRVSAEDDVGGLTVVEIVVPTAGCAFNIREGGDGAGFGKYGEVSNALDMGWDIELNGNNVLRDGAEAFAPHGYGLGKTYGNLIQDANAATNNGVYGANDPSTCTNYLKTNSMNYGALTVYRRHGEIVQELRRLNYVAKRYSTDKGATWSEWEWVNPPMAVGVEYRTTERFGGKAVYVKVIDFGALPNATTKSVSIGTEFTDVVDLAGIVYGTTGKSYNPIVTGMSGSLGLYTWVYGNTGTSNKFTVGIRAMTNLTDYTALIKLKYTKD